MSANEPRRPSDSARPTPARGLPPLPEVPSPCVNVCRMTEATALCEGCWRTLDEIALWSQLDADDKRAVLALIERRRADPALQPDPFGP